MSNNVCAISWCIGLATRSSIYCAVHEADPFFDPEVEGSADDDEEISAEFQDELREFEEIAEEDSDDEDSDV